MLANVAVLDAEKYGKVFAVPAEFTRARPPAVKSAKAAVPLPVKYASLSAADVRPAMATSSASVTAIDGLPETPSPFVTVMNAPAEIVLCAQASVAVLTA